MDCGSEAYRPLYRAVYIYRLTTHESFTAYRPLYRAVYIMNKRFEIYNPELEELIAHYIGLSTTYSKTAGFRWIILIAHYIGLSTVKL